MSKQQLFIDFDLTIADSIQAFCDTYNFLYSAHPNFVPANPHLICSYDFKYVCPLLQDEKDKYKIWGHKLFFYYLKLMDGDTYNILQKLNKKYQLIVVSIGNPKNISLKAKWLEANLPFIKDYVLITNEGCKMNKSVVNMEGAIFLDDIPSNLESTNAKRKILFGRIYPWNEGWQGEHCLTWKDFENKLLDGTGN